MITFKTFLEAQVKPYEHEEKELSELVALIKTHCSDSVDGQRIFRGSKSELKNGIFNPSSGERKSQNTANYYTKLVDSNPKNSKFPKRSQSFIATTREKTANVYGRGSVMVLFPYDGTAIGVVNSADFWDTETRFSPPFEIEHIVEMNGSWRMILQELGWEVSPDNIPELAELISFLKKSDPTKLCNALMDAELLSFAEFNKPENHKKLANKFISDVPKVYSYKSLGCTLTTPGKLDNEHSEVWFSGKCIGIRTQDFEEIKGELGL